MGQIFITTSLKTTPNHSDETLTNELRKEETERKVDRYKFSEVLNLSACEIEQIYGLRVRSRLREMFNLISFSKNVLNKWV